MVTTSKMKVLRSVFLEPEMDEALRQTAFRRRISKGELIRTYLAQGITSEPHDTSARITPQKKRGRTAKALAAGK
jgi:hypothetical protein